MKKGKHFYSHIIESSTLSLALGDLKLTQEERVKLISLAESNLHHEILDVVLSELSPDDKKVFLKHLADDDHDKIWEVLHNSTQKMEDKIYDAADKLKKELHEDIKEAAKKE
jgi:hypothetical protein